MTITISPSRKFAIMTGLVIVFLVAIHFGMVPYLNFLSDKIPKTVQGVLIVIVIIITFAGITYAKMFRPLVPGPSSWKQEKYWSTLTVEKSLEGVGKLIYWVAKIFIFSVFMYTALLNTIRIYVKNIPAIMNGTYVYDKIEGATMAAPLIMAFLLLLYISVRMYDHITTKEKKKNE